SLITRNEKEILDEWVKLQLGSDTHRADLVTERDVKSESQRFLEATRKATGRGRTSARRNEKRSASSSPSCRRAVPSRDSAPPRRRPSSSRSSSPSSPASGP